MLIKDKKTGRYLRDRLKIICANCKLEYETVPSGNVKYCSWSCCLALRNKKNSVSEEFLFKLLEMRKTMKLKDIAKELNITINRVNYFLNILIEKGLYEKRTIRIWDTIIPKERFSDYEGWLAKHRTPEYRKKLSESRLGEKGSNYMGGVTHERLLIRNSYRYRIWRAKIKERDNNTCVMCGITNVPLFVDHIISLVELLERYNIKSTKEATKCEELWDMENGRTVCLPCHKTTDTYGWGAYHLKRKRKYFESKKILEENEICGIVKMQ